jgi:hypothetical protein
MASKPWLGAIKEPTEASGPKTEIKKAPDVAFEFDFVHGYKSDKTYQNCLYNA